MMSADKFTSGLLAPCGIYCGICKAYLAYNHNVPRQRSKVTYCSGCRPRAKNCYIKRGCTKLRKHALESCSQCDVMPCKNLLHLDKRYRERYDMSMVENLKDIQANGMEAFLEGQRRKYRCSNCGGTFSVHNGKCYSCGFIREKKFV
jgi:hypothetical protein